MNLAIPEHLPIAAHTAEIIAAVAAHQVLVIAGDTGSGKTTQLPKLCLAAGRGKEGLIGCTQPRRIAAVSIAERVAAEVGTPEAVGYKIRFRDQTGAATRIKFMTDGVLLAETRQDRGLRRYDTLIIDEAHERSLNIDFLLGYLQNLLVARPDLKLLISSATLDTAKFSAHFGEAPVVNVSGRTYPVAIDYRPSQEDEEESVVEQAAREAVALAEEHPAGDILLFMPTERDILDCCETLSARLDGRAAVLPLFGRLHAADQRRVFRPSRLRKVIVATNIAETSLTLPGIRFVIDSGLARIARYHPRAGTASLLVSKISRASCDQRSGRCGRTGPGLCLRLYREEDYQARPAYTQPEIQRANLAAVILQMASLGLGDPRNFPFLDPPSAGAIRDGFRLLLELGAISEAGRLTSRGRIMATLPLDPCIARIIVEAAERGALREIKIIAAGLSIQDPRIRPAEHEEKADAAHRQFADRRSDFLSLLNIWHAFQTVAGKTSRSRLRKFCSSHFLSWQRMREWLDIHDQLTELIRHHPSFHDNSEPASFAAVHQALLSGFLRHIGQKKEKNLYLASGGREVMLFPGSALYNHGGPWLVCASLLETSRLYALTAASIDADWLEEIGGDLCRRSWAEPHWEKRSGQVTALEKVTLFGLVIVAGRRVNYGKVSTAAAAEAREIFIRRALVEGDLGGRVPFLHHNQNLLRQYRELEARTRRRDIVADEEALYHFYDTRLGQVFDRHTLNQEIRRHRGDRFLRMSADDICLALPERDELYRFPQTLAAGAHQIPLTYRFEPGHEADGVTATLTRSLLESVSPPIFEWLVPGLLEEKILHLLKALPKGLRRRLVPLPESAARIMDQLVLSRGSLYASLEQAILKLFQMRIERRDWQPDRLPPHLRMRFCLVAEDNTVIQTGRNFQELAAQVKPSAPPPPSADGAPAPSAPPPRPLTEWDFGEPPQPIPSPDGSGGLLYPALFLHRLHQTVELRYIPDRKESRQQNRSGLRHLFGRHFAEDIKALRRECKAAVTGHTASWLALAAGRTASELQEDLLAFVLDHLFALGSGDLPSADQFAAAVAQARQAGITRRGREMLNHLLRILAQRRETAARLQPPKQPGRATRLPDALRDELVTLLEELIPHDFLRSRSNADLVHSERYLKALAIRAERAALDPAKDRKKAEPVDVATRRLHTLGECDLLDGECCRCLDEYRQMVEELRVSVFAPELRTTHPVSAQRLQQKWQEVENACLRVE